MWTLYVAFKYRNSMEIFNHHNDGFVQSHHKKKPPSAADKFSLSKLDEFDLADVREILSFSVFCSVIAF